MYSFHIGGNVPKFSVISPLYYGEFRLHIGSINAQTFSNICTRAVIIILGSWLALNYIYLQFSSRADRSFGLSKNVSGYRRRLEKWINSITRHFQYLNKK